MKYDCQYITRPGQPREFGQGKLNGFVWFSGDYITPFDVIKNEVEIPFVYGYGTTVTVDTGEDIPMRDFDGGSGEEEQQV